MTSCIAWYLERSLVCACAAPAASLPVAVQFRQNVSSLADPPSLDEFSVEPPPEGGSVALKFVVSVHRARRYRPILRIGQRRESRRIVLRNPDEQAPRLNASRGGEGWAPRGFRPPTECTAAAPGYAPRAIAAPRRLPGWRTSSPASRPQLPNTTRGGGDQCSLTCGSGVRDPVVDRSPRLPGDAEDHRRDRESDERVGHIESERDHQRTENDSQTDVGVGASVVAIGHEGGAVEASACSRADEGSSHVAEEADRTCQGECEEVLRCLGVDDPHDRFVGGNAGADEDRQHDGKTRVALRSFRAQRERDARAPR